MMIPLVLHYWTPGCSRHSFCPPHQKGLYEIPVCLPNRLIFQPSSVVPPQRPVAQSSLSANVALLQLMPWKAFAAEVLCRFPTSATRCFSSVFRIPSFSSWYLGFYSILFRDASQSPRSQKYKHQRGRNDASTVQLSLAKKEPVRMQHGCVNICFYLSM